MQLLAVMVHRIPWGALKFIPHNLLLYSLIDTHTRLCAMLQGQGTRPYLVPSGSGQRSNAAGEWQAVRLSRAARTAAAAHACMCWGVGLAFTAAALLTS